MMLTSPSGGFRIEMLEPKRSLVLMIHDDEEKQGGEISSTFVLNPLDEQQTRLVLRLRAASLAWAGNSLVCSSILATL